MARVNQSELSGRLIDEAARLLTEFGPAGLSLRRLAAACGISTMPVYTLFGDKDGLLRAMHDEGFRRLRARLDAVERTGDPVADLIASGLAYREAALASPHLYGLMFGRTPVDSPPGEAADATYQSLTAAVVRCQRAGRFRAGPEAERIALHLWSVVHGMVSLELNDHLPPADITEPLFREALDFAVDPFRA